MISDFRIKYHSGYNPKVSLLLAAVLIIVMHRCIYPFEPVIDKYENLLVVDGLLTNIPGNCFVKLSRTYKYDEKPDSVETGARVMIIDDLGIETQLKEFEAGVYLPEDTLFAGETGRIYRVQVTTLNGEILESTPEELKEPVDIEEIYFEYLDKGNGIQGLQLYLDTYDSRKKSFYYSWDYEETWEISVPFQSLSEYLPEMKICYRNSSSRKIFIQSTKEYSDDRIIKYPLFFVGNTTNRLMIKYSVLVRQYVLTEKTYEFFSDLKEINENTGTLFDRTPVILIGNMINKLYPDKPVLGNFQISGASELRIFINRDNLPPQMNVATEYEFCKADLVSKKNESFRLDSLLHTGWIVMDTIYEPDKQDTLIGLANSRSCFDCTLNGDIVKPDFWDEK